MTNKMGSSDNVDNMKNIEVKFSESSLTKTKEFYGNIKRKSEENLEMTNIKTSDTERVHNIEQREKTKLKRLRDRFELIWKNITVEPVLGCYFVPSILSLLCAQNVYLDRACRVNLNYSSNICDALIARETENYTQEEINVQQLVASALSWKSAVQTVIPCIIIIFAGAWSDLHGKRKIFITLPILGELVAYSSFAAAMYFVEDISVETMALIESVPQALSGGWFVMLLGIFSYISDITTMENRTFRIGVVNVFMSLGVPFGTSLSGLLLNRCGYYSAFLVSIVLYLASLIYGIIRIHDVPRPKDKDTTSLTLFTSFFNLRSLKGTWDIAFRDGSFKRRIKIALIMFTVLIVFGPTQGELSIQYLYTRYKFGWNEVSYSLFSTYSMTMFFIGTMIAMGLFSARWELEDATIGIIASSSTIGSAFVYVFATATWTMYLAPLLDIFNGTSYIALRSIASKVVSSDERGKVNSLFGVAESVTPVLFSPLYLRLYMATITTFPGAVYFTSAALAVIAVLIFIWMYRQRDVSERHSGNSSNSGN